MKIISWNVNGVRAAVKKGFAEKVKQLDPDILCLQETKAQDDQVAEALEDLSDFHIVSNSAVRKGYSGVAVISKKKPLSIKPDMGIEEHDQEGRVLCAEFEEFQIVVVYVPNSGNGLARLDYRAKWDKDFCDYLKELEKHKPVIVVGDFNVAHQEIDIARPKPNYNKTAGYTQKEIDGMDRFVNSGLVDSFRMLHPDTVKYSWWSFRGQARANNIGWRLDYCLVSDSLMEKVSSAFILNEVDGSDHCPVGLELN
ncbi:MAG: exodeoxyribonuclease III [Flavobacteriales bacterium]|nr:exodeoxyribonuclease III [Flavobacteriales bacterium]